MGLVDAVEDIGDAVMDAGKGIAQVFNHAGPLGNPIPVIGALSKLDDVIEAGSRVVDWVKGGSDKVRRTANSPILQGGQLVIAGMRRTTGTGEPDHGDQFGQGSQQVPRSVPGVGYRRAHRRLDRQRRGRVRRSER